MKQITNTIMMVRPSKFRYNEQTAENNSFQTKGDLSLDEVRERAVEEFDAMVSQLRSKGINVIVIEDTPIPAKPDAIFPNNWISFHEDGTVITYPMFAENRRIERREDIIDQLEQNYIVKRRYSFDYYEEESKFLEGTGSMLLDRQNKIVYACLSPRTDVMVLDKFCVLMGYEKVVFHSLDRNGDDIYHTNVMMALGKDFSVVCLESISNEAEKELLKSALKQSNKQIIEIAYDQVEAFAGNMLQVAGSGNEDYLVMSQNAYNSLTEDQKSVLNSLTEIVSCPINTIETRGGGSVRCMMAEVFLESKLS